MKKLFSYKYTDNAISFALLILRLTVGGLMVPHGFDKLKNFGEYAEKFKDPFGLNPTISLGLLTFAEFFCAVLIVVGLMTRLATIPLIIAMSVALIYAHKTDIFGEGQTVSLFLFGFVALLFSGPGKFSMDKLIGK